MTRVVVRTVARRTVPRRSIVEFEKWLDSQIVTATDELMALNVEAEELARRQMLTAGKLETFRIVKARLGKSAFPPVSGTVDETVSETEEKLDDLLTGQ